MHKPISITNLSLSFPRKPCFKAFTCQIHFGARIAIIGRNGSGKSTLLKMILGKADASSGNIDIPNDASFGYVPQIVEDFELLSGGERFNKVLTAALARDPNVLLLDEPTNHLDRKNRKSLMRMLQNFHGTLIIASHDLELIEKSTDTLWHIQKECHKISVFSGNYHDYMDKLQRSRVFIEKELARLDQEKKEMHQALMKEQKRSSKSKAKGKKKIENKQWMKSTADIKAMRAEKSQGSKFSVIAEKKLALTEKLSSLELPEIILPTFSLSASNVRDYSLLSITKGTIGYHSQKPLIRNINLSLSSKERIAIIGDNRSGKSTLIKGILDDPSIVKEGEWLIPSRQDIGYLDQHYAQLSPQNSVFESIVKLVPTWSHEKVRRLLVDFLFRTNEEVHLSTNQLSGGEKARLSLAQIAAKTPRLLILDEITNNLDLETKEHITHVLSNYPAAIIMISHDEEFLKNLNIHKIYKIENGLIDSFFS